MLKQGFFIDESGVEYTVYEQVVDGLNRLSFYEKNANFHTDVGSVKSSIVKQKDMLVYGDRNIYRNYDGLLDSARQMNVRNETSSG